MATFIQDAIDISSTFDSRLSDGDLEGLLELLAPDAVSRTPQGEVLSDPDSIRENLAGMIAAGALLENHPRHVFVAGETALLIIDWTLTLRAVDGTPTMTGTTANVATRSDNGSWRLSVLNPMGTM